jgi:hypothetical protein
MGKLIKLLIVAAFAGGLLYAGSYAGARATVGKFIGSPTPELGTRTIHLALGGVKEIPDHPRAWEFNYSKVEANGNRPARVFVSLDGKIITTVPKDLDQRLEAWRKTKEIQ